MDQHQPSPTPPTGPTCARPSRQPSRRRRHPKGALLLNRRTLLRGFAAAGAGVLLTACGGEDFDPFASPASQTAEGQDEAAAQQSPQQAESSQAAEAQNQAAAAVAEEPAAALPEPLVYVLPNPAAQGQTVLLVVEAPGAQAASMSWQGQAFSLLQTGERFIGFFGLDANALAGPQALGVAVWGPRGEQLLWQQTVIEVEAVEWTMDDIQIDGPNAMLLQPAVRQQALDVRTPFQSALTPQLHWLGVFDPPSEGQITALYGEQRSFNGGPIEEYHTGIDFGGLSGSAVTAANSGIVSWAGQTRRRGNGMIIDHGAGVFSGYYHLSELLQNPGTVVEQGSLIARMGATGLATGPHLHWEVVVRGVTVNPLPWLRLLEFPDPHQELNPLNALSGANLAAG